MAATMLSVASPTSAQPTPPRNLGVEYRTYLAHAPPPIDNPLKGIAANTSHTQSARDRFPHSLIFSYVPLRDVVIGPTNYDWAALESALSFATNDHCQLIPRFFLDYPGRATSAIPQYLLDGGLQTWTYSDYGNVHSLFPDYEDPNLRTALTNFIAAYGAQYDGDPRIAFVQIGTLGVWGEWHYGGSSMLSHWASLETQAEIMNAYAAAFTKTKLQFRYPAGTNNDAGGVATYRNDNLPFGYYDDSFGGTTIPTVYMPTVPQPQSWYQMAEMRLAGATNHWKQWPNGGEPGGSTLWFFIPTNSSSILPGQDWTNLVHTTHSTFIHVWSLFYTNAYGFDMAAAYDGARMLGYELWVKSFSTWTSSNNLMARVTLTNTGVAPFYYDWPVEVGTAPAVLVAEGDSITCRDAAGGGYPYLAWLTMTNNGLAFTNLAVSGSRFSALTNRAATVDALYTSGLANVVSVLIGANDLDGMTLSSVTNYWRNLRGYLLDRRSKGFKTVVCTVTPRTSSTFVSARNTLNALIRSDASCYDAIADFAADAVMGPDSAAADLTIYSDGLHPTAHGQSLLAPIYRAAVINLPGVGHTGQLWSTPWKLTSVIPGNGDVHFDLVLTNAPARPFTLLMRAVNPLAVGKPLRFANASQNATVTNWLTLGVVH